MIYLSPIKKQFLIMISFIFLMLSTGAALSETPSVGNNLTIHVPCAEYLDNGYDLLFEPVSLEPSDSYASDALFWKLFSIAEAAPDAHCIKIQENSLNLIIPEIQYNETPYALSLYSLSSPETEGSILWQPGTLFELAPAEKNRNTEDSVQNMADMIDGLKAFNIDFYKNMIQEGQNLFYSPLSISTALAMTYAGARNETAEQMEDALHWSVDPETLHAGFNYLDLELEKRGEGAGGQDGDGFRLNISNNVWGQKGHPFRSEYLNILSEYYGTKLALLDFMNEPENSRQTINAWVSDQTENKINDLVPYGAIDDSTLMVLTNAIYFNAAWLFPFEADNTVNAPFWISETESVSVPMMSKTRQFNYAESEDFQAVELLYDGREMSMLIILPRENHFADFENNLTSDQIDSITDSLTMTNVQLEMPRFDLEPDGISLKKVLQQMGMTLGFTPYADFSGITDAADIYISDVIHKAFIRVDEEGTEAAAATVVIVVPTSIPVEPVQMLINRPFIFMIKDIKTDVVLFMGRMVSP